MKITTSNSRGRLPISMGESPGEDAQFTRNAGELVEG